MMYVKAYNTAKYKNTSIYKVDKIDCMPDQNEINWEDIQYADGILLTLWCNDGRTICMPHNFIISITTEEII